MILPKITLQVGNNNNNDDDDDDDVASDDDDDNSDNNYHDNDDDNDNRDIRTLHKDNMIFKELNHLFSLGYFQFLPKPSFCIILGCLTNLDEFIAKLPEEAKFSPMGELLHSYKCSDVEYEIYKVIFYYLCLSCNFSLSSDNSMHMLLALNFSQIPL